MAFHYKSPSGIRINSAEEQLLESIDNSSLKGFASLGILHHNLKGGVLLSDETRTRPYAYEIGISELDEEISKINEELSKRHAQYAKAHIDKDKDKDKVDLIEKELGILRKKLSKLKKTKTDCQNAINGKCEIKGKVAVLGEYDSTSNQVILYYKSISSKELLAVVYVHEMMHAYLDCGGITLPEIEEPIVEYAMLNYFNAYDKSICIEAENHVKEKQQVLGVAHYGFGYCLFTNSNGVDWLEDYRNAKNSIVKTDPNVAAYLYYWKKGIYPEEKEKECLEALYKALHHGSFKVMKVQSASKVVYEQSKNKIDLIRKLDDYLAKHSPIAPLGNAVIPSDHKIRLYRGWKDSSARQYYDWLDPKKHSELIPLLNKHGLYGSIYNCVDLQQIANIYKELVDKTTPEAINAYGNSENMVSAIRHFIEHLLEINHIIL